MRFATYIERLGQVPELSSAFVVAVATRGLRAVVKRAIAYGITGLAQFFYWLLEVSAYERRCSPRRYARWLCAKHAVVSHENESGAVITVRLRIATLDDHSLQCIHSVLAQTHRAWRLRIHCDAGAHPDKLPSDPRISLETVADAHDQGPVLLLDALSCLEPTALAELTAFMARKNCDLVFCDEDLLVRGRRCAPYLKPGFSIDLLRAEDYIGPTVLVRSIPEDCRNSYEVCLRAYEAGARCERLPRVLVHRLHPRAFPLGSEATKDVHAHLVRCYGALVARALTGAGPAPPAHASLVIPTRDRVDLLERCLDSVYASKPQCGFDVLILDNRSIEARSLAWFARAPTIYPDLRVLGADYEFNWSRLNNQGVVNTQGSVLVFMNNDIEVIERTWLDRLVAHACRSDVATVGALLLYPDRTIQHAGIVVGLKGIADHVYSGCSADPRDRHVFTSPLVPRNVMASTGACLAMRRETLAFLGPFDEQFAVCGDVEMGVRAHRHGLLNVYDPNIRLLHHEFATRRTGRLPTVEVDRLRAVCQEFIRTGDPFYNPGLTRRLRYPTFAAFKEA